MPDDSIWDEDTPLGEQIDETMRRRKAAGLKPGESFPQAKSTSSESVIKTPADVPAELERVKKGKARNVDLEWLLRRAGKKK